MVIVGDVRSDWLKINVIQLERSKFNGDGKWYRSAPEVFSRGLAANAFGARLKICPPMANTESLCSKR